MKNGFLAGALPRSDAEKRPLETSRYETAQGAGTGNTLPESGIVPEEQ